MRASRFSTELRGFLEAGRDLAVSGGGRARRSTFPLAFSGRASKKMNILGMMVAGSSFHRKERKSEALGASVFERTTYATKYLVGFSSSQERTTHASTPG